MKLVLELTAEEQSRLRSKAARRGLDDAAFLRMLSNEREAEPPLPPGSPAEAVATWEREGLLGVFADRPDSPRFARQLRERASTRDWT